jgi:hypothetical protein
MGFANDVERVQKGNPMAEVKAAADTGANGKTAFEKHYAELLPEFKALSPDKVDIVNLDITATVATILGAYPEIIGKAEELRSEVPNFDVEKMKRLDAYAMALSHAHTLYLVAAKPPDELEPLIQEGTALREVLFSDAAALVKRGLMNGARLAELLGPIGYKNLASDLQVLAAVFRDHFPQIEGKCATSRAEVSRADEISAEVLRAVGLKEQGTALIAATSDIRSRAFTVVTELYDQTRRALLYLRWNEDDADTIAPSLYSGRSARKKGAKEEAKPPVPPVPVPETRSESAAQAQSPPPSRPNPTDPFLS